MVKGEQPHAFKKVQLTGYGLRRPLCQSPGIFVLIHFFSFYGNLKKCLLF